MRVFGRFLVVILLALVGMSGFAQSKLRIVSLAPSITKMLYLLDEGKNVVGCTSYCEVEPLAGTTVVASAIDVSIEKVFLLKPDLVLATTITKPTTLDALRKLGIRVVQFGTTKSFDEICGQLQDIGKLVGKEDLAKQITATQKARLATVKSEITGNAHPKVFMQIGAKPIFTVLDNTFMNDFITFMGGVNVAKGLTRGTMTRESVLLMNPDIIIVTTMGIMGAEEKGVWMGYKDMSAVKSNKVIIINSDKACSPTPIDFVDTLQEIITLLNK